MRLVGIHTAYKQHAGPVHAKHCCVKHDQSGSNTQCGAVFRILCNTVSALHVRSCKTAAMSLQLTKAMCKKPQVTHTSKDFLRPPTISGVTSLSWVVALVLFASSKAFSTYKQSTKPINASSAYCATSKSDHADVQSCGDSEEQHSLRCTSQ